MTVPVEQLSFIPTGATTKRSLGDWTSDPFLNVKNFGATGNGSTDDTAAIQSCLDAAFGTYASPHGVLNPTSNKPVFFPAGTYKVSSSFSTTVTGTANDGTGRIKLAVTTTSGLSTNDVVNVSSVGGTVEANQSWAIIVNDANHITLLSSSFSNAWTSGGIVVNCALRVRAVLGGYIFGAGRQSTIITSSTAGGITFGTNGFEYSVIERLNFAGTGSHSIAFDLNWQTGNPLGSNEASLQANTFSDCAISGGDYGLAIGFGQNMGSETAVWNCDISGCAIAGLVTANGNALNCTVHGGNFQQDGTGILVAQGAIPGMFGVTFEVSTTQDIYIKNAPSTPTDGYAIMGCRSESTNFLNCPVAATIAVIGCTQSGGTGFFITGNPIGIVAGCASSGTIEGFSPDLMMVGNNFSNAGVLSSNYNGSIQNPQLRNYRVTRTTDLTLLRRDSGTCFDNIGAGANVNLTLPGLNDSDGVESGITYDIYIAAAHEVKFTATNGLKIRDGGNLSAANGKIASSTIGDYVSITSTTPTGDWVVKSKNGTGWVVT